MSNTALKQPYQKELFGHPVGLYVLFFTEMWERFSYYGMRAILVLYMISSATGSNPGLGWSNSDALALYGWYTMLVYLMSIPGGILADKYVGQKKAVLYGGLVLVAGHSILAITAPWAFFTGLALIVIGVGGLKPNISTMVGGLYPPKDERRDSGFTIFYIGINVGAFLAAIIVGYVGEEIGWHYGFGLAGIGMLLGQIVYMAGQKFLTPVGNPPSKGKKGQPSLIDAENEDENTSFGQLFANLLKSPVQLAITLIAIVGLTILAFNIFEELDRYLYAGLFTFLALVAGLMMMIYKDINSIEKDRFIVLLVSFLIIIVFWGAFEQAGGLLNIYTDSKIDRFVSLNVLDILFYGSGIILLVLGIIKKIKKSDISYIFITIALLILGIYFFFKDQLFHSNPYEIPTSVFQSVNALFIIIFGTIVSGVWLWWAHKGKEHSSLFKMAIGTIIMGAGFLFMAKASSDVTHYGDKAALILLILAYLFHTIGELCTSPVALSFITKVAPVKYVSIMMGVYFAATGLGNKVAGSIGEASQAKPVKIQLASKSVVQDGLVKNEDFSKAHDFELISKAYLKGNDIFYIDNSFNDLLTVKNNDLFVEYLKGEEATENNPKTVIARFSYDKDKKMAVEEGKITVNSDDYSGTIEVFDMQNKLEFKTYVYIFILTLVFGILLLIFLKKLKKLTHGAESLEIDDKEEAETFELGEQDSKK
ncbi:MFS transporter [Aureibaculum marinum]|uniref:MFS transporter n=1 Tax=Aureibaculum marinum TaxID=2487930 RepID=A0A3N4NMI6_9FLAO|nr:peptide MFS transporter [Aureibaculum marinum]RPD97524.1 MFS transporter [Aureibaculum marinum]